MVNNKVVKGIRVANSSASATEALVNARNPTGFKRSTAPRGEHNLQNRRKLEPERVCFRLHFGGLTRSEGSRSGQARQPVSLAHSWQAAQSPQAVHWRRLARRHRAVG